MQAKRRASGVATMRFCFPLLGIVLAGLLVAIAGVEPAGAEQRLAFVVGINTYAHLGPEAQLQRAVEDAESVSNQLAKLGFDVTTLGHAETVSQDVFLSQFDRWASKINPGDTVLFYFAGHGVSINGSNYLVPADIPNLNDADEHMFRAHALGETDIRGWMQEHDPGVIVMMLDACRNNPFNTADRALSHERGLERVDSAKGVLTIYAAGYGQTALDRLSNDDDLDPNSVFTRVVLAELAKPGINLVDFSEDVRERVAALARSVGHDQIPAVDNQLLGGRSVYLSGSDAGWSKLDDEAAWREIQVSLDASIFRRFVLQFPDSTHRSEAENRIKRLDRLEPPATQPAVAKAQPVVMAEPASAPRPPAPAAPRPDAVRWTEVATAETPQPLRDFLRSFPTSDLRAPAESRLRDLDDTAWSKASTADPPTVRSYIAAFPNGRHRPEADARLATLETPPVAATPVQATVEPPPPVPAGTGLRHVQRHHEAHRSAMKVPTLRRKPHARTFASLPHQETARRISHTAVSRHCFAAAGRQFCE